MESAGMLSEDNVINTLHTVQGKIPADQIQPTNEIYLEDIFSSEVPPSVECLLYNTNTLTLQSHRLQFDSLKYIYEQVINDITTAQRQRLFQYIISNIESASLDAVALIPLIRFETDHTLTTLAVQAYLRNRRVSFNYPLGATEDLVGLLDAGRVTNHGAVFSAMVCFGDRRICTALRPLRDSISPLEAKAFALAATSQLHKCTLEFCLTWLVDLVKKEKFSVAIQIASAISSMVINDSTSRVQSLQYNFGPFGFSTATIGESVSLEEALQEYTPIIETLSTAGIPSLDLMVEVFRDPGGSSLDQVERRRTATSRRVASDRRASDRRIVSLTPRIERRQASRREGARRTMKRR